MQTIMSSLNGIAKTILIAFLLLLLFTPLAPLIIFIGLLWLAEIIWNIPERFEHLHNQNLALHNELKDLRNELMNLREQLNR